MTDLSEFESIRPYTDEETVEALARVARHPMIPAISKYLFPKQPANTLSKAISQVHSVDEFQRLVMQDVVTGVIARTSEGFTVSGIENLAAVKGRKFLAVSNHRDIVLDPALICSTFLENGINELELCVGSNLLKGQLIEDLMRSNRMIKVIRGISARQLYLSSQILSKYIRTTITEGRACVWVAQREGRTKNGLDTTEQGLLKMFDMSGEGTFTENFEQLGIVPLSISYEYEPCDSRKARELYIKQTTGEYVKRRNEDTHSILTGIRQQKGHIHLAIGRPLTHDEIEEASHHTGNDRYQAIRQLLNDRINSGYRLWKTNYMAYDLMNGRTDFLGIKYLPEDLENFGKYINHKLGKLERRLDRETVRDIFLHIYGNPVSVALQKSE